MRKHSLVMVLATGVLLISSRVAWAQANITLMSQGENKNCSVEVAAWAEDWCWNAFVTDQDSDYGTSSASATATALGASATGTGNAYGGTSKFAPEKADVWARGKFTAGATGFDDGCGWGDAGVQTAQGSSEQWANFRINGNGGIDNNWGLPRGWVYVVEGTYELTISGDGGQWASVQGPGVSLTLTPESGLSGSVSRVQTNGSGCSEVVTQEFNGDMVTSASGTWSAIVNPNDIIQIAAGGSAGMPTEEWAWDNAGLTFSYTGEGKATMSITGVPGRPPVCAGPDPEPEPGP